MPEPATELTPKVPSKSSVRWPSARLLTGIVLALTFAVYAQTLGFEFVHDDVGQIVENPAVQSWHYLSQYFTAQVWAGVTPELLGNYYRPLFLIWLRLNDATFGLHPWAWHLTTVLLHVAVTGLVYLLACRIVKDRWTALLAALIFGLHPVHIEAVAWISGVTEPLLAVLLIPAFLFYLDHRERRDESRKWLGLSLTFYVLAMLEKETALALPVIIFAYEWLRWGNDVKQQAWWTTWVGRGWSAFRSAAPYLLPIPFYALARVHALKAFSHVITSIPLSTVVLTWPSLLWFWTKHLFWPAELSTFYDLPAVSEPNFANFTLPLILMVIIAGALFLAARRHREIAFASIWLVLPLLPLLDIRVFIEDDFAHDRYLYLPSVGFAIVVAFALRRLPWFEGRLKGLPAVPVASALVLTPLLGFGTVWQSFYFENNFAFYRHNVASAPRNKIARTNLATLLGKEGKYGPAIQLFNQVLSDDPGYWHANYNLGYTYYRLGNLEAADHYLRRAIRINPNKPDEYFYLGMTRFKQGRVDVAADAIRQAVRIRPEAYAYHFALGVVLKSKGDLAGALEQFKETLALNPNEEATREQIREVEALLAKKQGGSGDR